MRLAIVSDFLEENWPSMDLLADELVRQVAQLPGVTATQIRPPMLAPFRRAARASSPSAFWHNADRFSGRYLEYSLRMLRERGRFDRYHLADHSYAHLALVLASARTGVFCHDIDAFRPLFDERAARWQKAIARVLLAGIRRAGLVFHSTELVRAEILEHHLVPADRLVHAPYGVASEFQPEPTPEDEALRRGPPYLLHVGSLIPRKNPEFLVRVFGAAARVRPDLEFWQAGGEWSPALERLVDELGIREKLRRLPRRTQRELAPLYRNARAVLMPSLAEGFGLPVVEALACGAPVLASDIPVFRQVGGDAVSYCPTGVLEAWQARLSSLMAEDPKLNRPARLARAAKYSWRAHAEIIVNAHRQAFERERG
ncbi:MAG TPA: glycosyltransferase family 1 protein [Polyangiaceae bacterium]